MKLIWNLILIVLIIWNFGLTIILIVQSEKNDNKIGASVGYILMTFLLIFPISLYLVGKNFVEYYNCIWIFNFLYWNYSFSRIISECNRGIHNFSRYLF